MQQFSRAIIKNNDKYLLIKEYKREEYNVWNFPGGKPDAGESIEASCKREVFEELGLRIENLKIFHKGYYTYTTSGDWEGFYYLCNCNNVADLKIQEPEKCDGYCWLKLTEIKDIKRLGIATGVLDMLEGYNE